MALHLASNNCKCSSFSLTFTEGKTYNLDEIFGTRTNGENELLVKVLTDAEKSSTILECIQENLNLICNKFIEDKVIQANLLVIVNNGEDGVYEKALEYLNSEFYKLYPELSEIVAFTITVEPSENGLMTAIVNVSIDISKNELSKAVLDPENSVRKFYSELIENIINNLHITKLGGLLLDNDKEKITLSNSDYKKYLL